MKCIHDLMARACEGAHITLDFVGDSITHGLTHCRPEETYIAKVAAEIARRYPTCTVRRYDGFVDDEFGPLGSFDGPILVSLGTGEGVIDIIRNAVWGNTVRRALNRLDDFTGTLANGRTPDATLIMLGINDSLEGDPTKYVPPAVFKQDYKGMLDLIRERNPDTAFVLVGATYNGDSIAPYCAATEALAAEEGIPYIDLFSFWMAHYDPAAPHFGQGDWLSDVSWDACHPTPKGSELTARRVCEALLGEIQG